MSGASVAFQVALCRPQASTASCFPRQATRAGSKPPGRRVWGSSLCLHAGPRGRGVASTLARVNGDVADELRKQAILGKPGVEAEREGVSAPAVADFSHGSVYPLAARTASYCVSRRAQGANGRPGFTGTEPLMQLETAPGV